MGNRRWQDEEVNYVNDSNRGVGILKNRNVELLRISEASGNYLPEEKKHKQKRKHIANRQPKTATAQHPSAMQQVYVADWPIKNATSQKKSTESEKMKYTNKKVL